MALFTDESYSPTRSAVPSAKAFIPPINFAKTQNIENYPLLKNAKSLNYDGELFGAG